MGRFKTLLMLTNAMYDVPPLPLAAIHRFHPIESVLGEVDVADPPHHLAHLGQTDSTIFNLAKKLWKKVAISRPWRNIHYFFFLKILPLILNSLFKYYHGLSNIATIYFFILVLSNDSEGIVVL